MAYPPLLLVQDGGDTGRLPVAEQAPHVRRTVGLALDEFGLVADRPLLLGDLGDIGMHALGADLHVAYGMVVIGLGIALPGLHAGRHQLAHRRLEVVVADDAAGDAGGAGRDVALVHNRDVGTVATALRLQPKREVVGGAEAVDSGPDDQIFDVPRKRHLCALSAFDRPIVGGALKRAPSHLSSQLWSDRIDQL